MGEPVCRSCRGRTGHLVLDLGEQPPCDYFPRRDDPGPDPAYPLQMWLCSSCGLAQLVADPTVPEEPRGAEPAALVQQAADAVRQVAAAGLLPGSGLVAEYGSPHGGSWLGLLARHGLTPSRHGEQADIVLDCFGLMHAADQADGLAERAARVAAGGVLLLQYHSLAAIIRCGQWNALRHGHYAYYSTTALAAMLAAHGFGPRRAWQFPLYGGTVLLAATRDTDAGVRPDGADVPDGGDSPDGPDSGDSPDGPDSADGPDSTVQSLLADDARVGVRDPAVLGGLQRSALARAEGLRGWLAAERSAGHTVLGYGAASRAVALLRRADVDSSLLPAVIDASPAKQGLRMPGTDIPVVSPEQLAVRRPAAVVLFLSDLMTEVRAAFPEVEAAGGRWVDADTIGSSPAGG